MCIRYRIIYFGRMSKEKLPSCTPERSQIREYVDSDGWQLCKESANEKPCKHARLDTCTFVEPYCSDACEKYFDGIDELEGSRDRLRYADDEIEYDGYFPKHASFGHLRVDHERVMSLYNGLIDLVNHIASSDDPVVEFPITASFPARWTASFLMADKSKLGQEIIRSFSTLELEEKLQLLQRLMAMVSFPNGDLRPLSCQATFMFESRGTRDDEHWQTYAQNAYDRDKPPTSFPIGVPKPISAAQQLLRDMVVTLGENLDKFDSEHDLDLMAISKEIDDLDAITETDEAATKKKLHNQGIQKEPPLFKGVDVDPYDPYPEYESEDEIVETSLPVPNRRPRKLAEEPSSRSSK